MPTEELSDEEWLDLIDLQRAEGEGMGQMFDESVSSKEEKGNDPLAKFLRRVVEEFAATQTVLGVEEGVTAVWAKSGEEEKAAVVRAVNDRLDGKEMNGDEVGEFLEVQGGELLRGLLGEVLGAEELVLLEAEEARRQMTFDRDFRGTPG